LERIAAGLIGIRFNTVRQFHRGAIDTRFDALDAVLGAVDEVITSAVLSRARRYARNACARTASTTSSCPTQPPARRKDNQHDRGSFASLAHTLTCEDGNGHAVYSIKIEFTDFPLEEIILYFTNQRHPVGERVLIEAGAARGPAPFVGPHCPPVPDTHETRLGRDDYAIMACAPKTPCPDEAQPADAPMSSGPFDENFDWKAVAQCRRNI